MPDNAVTGKACSHSQRRELSKLFSPSLGQVHASLTLVSFDHASRVFVLPQPGELRMPKMN
jgi:hypothetical protein